MTSRLLSIPPPTLAECCAVKSDHERRASVIRCIPLLFHMGGNFDLFVFAVTRDLPPDLAHRYLDARPLSEADTSTVLNALNTIVAEYVAMLNRATTAPTAPRKPRRP